MKELLQAYKRQKTKIKKRLNDFRENFKKDDRALFSELCFCLLTPQADAVSCDKAIKELERTKLLFKGTKEEIRPKLKKTRFLNKKSEYLLKARSVFKKNGYFYIKRHIRKEDIDSTRDWLVKNVTGMGYKEASHFLRNIGFGKDIAILDSHILKNLKKYFVIDRIPKSLTRSRYLDIEGKMKEFSKKIGIGMGELDLLFWSLETGFVFK